MARCEDYPCCGCGPEGCIDFGRTVECGDCGQGYHPDQNTQEFCYRCQAAEAMSGCDDCLGCPRCEVEDGVRA